MKHFDSLLIEMLVVVSITSVLMSILLPSLAGARKSAKNTLCISQLNQIGQFTQIYANDFKGYWPENTGSLKLSPVLQDGYTHQLDGGKVLEYAMRVSGGEDIGDAVLSNNTAKQWWCPDEHVYEMNDFDTGAQNWKVNNFSIQLVKGSYWKPDSRLLGSSRIDSLVGRKPLGLESKVNHSGDRFNAFYSDGSAKTVSSVNDVAKSSERELVYQDASQQ